MFLKYLARLKVCIRTKIGKNDDKLQQIVKRSIVRQLS